MSSSIWQGSQVIQSSANADNTYKAQRFIATEGQTLFTLTSFVYAVGSGSLVVEVNGVSQFIGNDFTETANNKVTLVTPAEDGDVVVIRGFIGGTNAVAAEQSATNSYNYSIDSANYAAASLASYNAILALSLPNLPLTIANGGTGTNTKAAAFLALAPTPTGNAGKVIGTVDGINYSLVANGSAQGGQYITGNTTLTATSPANVVVAADVNTAQFSEQLDNAVWTKFGTCTVTPNATIAPNGTLTADQVFIPASSGIYQSLNIAGNQKTQSYIWLRAATACTVDLVVNNNLAEVTRVTCNVTTSWQRFSLPRITSAGTTSLNIQLDTIVGATSIYVWGAQRNTYQTADNSVLFPTDIDNAAWGKAAITVVPNSITGLDGQLTVDSIQETTAVNSYHAVFQQVTKAAVRQSWEASCIVKDKGRQVAIILASLLGGGVTFRFNPATGLITSAPVSFGGFSNGWGNVVNLGNGFYLLTVAGVSDTDTNIRCQIELYNGANTYTGDGVSGTYIAFGGLNQIVDVPYSKTESALGGQAGLYVTLPAANTCAAGVNLFTVRNDTKFDYGLKDGAGNKLGWIRSGQLAAIGLIDNTTVAGAWTTANVEKIGVTAETNVTRQYSKSLQLDANRILFWTFTSPNFYGVIYDASTGLFGAETLLFTNNFVHGYAIIKSATNQVAIVYSRNDNISETALTVTCTGTSLSPNAAVNFIAGGFVAYRAFTTQSGTNLALCLVGTSLVYTIIDDSNSLHLNRVITITGTVPAFSTTPQSVACAVSGNRVESFASGSIARIVQSNSGGGLTCTPYTVTGTTLTPGTNAVIPFTGAQNVYLNINNNIIAGPTGGSHAAVRLTGTVEAVNTLTIASRDRLFQLSGNTFVSWVAATGVTSLVTDTAGVLSATTGATLIPTTINGVAATMTPVSNVGNVVKFVGAVNNNIRITYINYGVSPPVITSDVTYSQNVTNGATIADVPVIAVPGITAPNLLINGSTECALHGIYGALNSVLATIPTPKVLTTGHLAGRLSMYGFTKNEAWGSSSIVLQRVELAA